MSSLLWPILALVLSVLAGVLLMCRRIDLREDAAPRRDVLRPAPTRQVDWDAPDPDEDVPPAFRGIL